LQGEEINTLIEAETKTHANTAKSTKTWLNIFNERKLQRNEVRRFEDIPPEELDAILCRFFANNILHIIQPIISYITICYYLSYRGL